MVNKHVSILDQEQNSELDFDNITQHTSIRSAIILGKHIALLNNQSSTLRRVAVQVEHRRRLDGDAQMGMLLSDVLQEGGLALKSSGSLSLLGDTAPLADVAFLLRQVLFRWWDSGAIRIRADFMPLLNLLQHN